jgi:hypothetical protein
MQPSKWAQTLQAHVTYCMRRTLPVKSCGERQLLQVPDWAEPGHSWAHLAPIMAHAATTKQNPSCVNRRRRLEQSKPGQGSKRKFARSDEPVRLRSNKPSAKFLKVLQKRARDYNSDDDDEYHPRKEEEPPRPRRGRHDDRDDDEEEAASSSGDEAGGSVTRFQEGCRAFRVAFQKIMAKKFPDDPLVRNFPLH